MKKTVARAALALMLLSLLLSFAACANANTAGDSVVMISLIYDENSPYAGAVGGSSSGSQADSATPAAAPAAAPAATPTPAAPAAADTTASTTAATTAAPSANDSRPAAADTTAAPAADTPAPAETPAEQPASTSNKPEGAQAILDFYKKSINDIKDNGAAGFYKKAYQTIGDLNITGIGAVDNFIKSEVGKRMHPESDPVIDDDQKGSDEAKRHMAKCTLTDVSKIVSATCDEVGGNYNIKIVLQDEDTPVNADSSFLAQITDNIMFKEDIDKELAGLGSAIKDPVYHVVYKNTTIDATMTPDGKFISLHHNTTAAIQVDSVKILVFPLNNKGVSMTADIDYSDFRY